jgi:hypothetical protein
MGLAGMVRAWLPVTAQQAQPHEASSTLEVFPAQVIHQLQVRAQQTVIHSSCRPGQKEMIHSRVVAGQDTVKVIYSRCWSGQRENYLLQLQARTSKSYLILLQVITSRKFCLFKLQVRKTGSYPFQLLVRANRKLFIPVAGQDKQNVICSCC